MQKKANDLVHHSGRIDRLQDPDLEATDRAKIVKSFRKRGQGYRDIRKIVTDYQLLLK